MSFLNKFINYNGLALCAMHRLDFGGMFDGAAILFGVLYRLCS